MRRPRNKTLAAWLALAGGLLGLHRFYLFGPRDAVGWLLPLPAAAGAYGLWRARSYGIDDGLSWLLIPAGGFAFAACALTAIVYGLAAPERWNARHNPQLPADAPAGRTHWATVGCVVLALMVGATVLMASTVYAFQRFFEHQIEEARKISQ